MFSPWSKVPLTPLGDGHQPMGSCDDQIFDVQDGMDTIPHSSHLLDHGSYYITVMKQHDKHIDKPWDDLGGVLQYFFRYIPSGYD